MAGNPKSNKKMIAIGGVVLLIALHRLGGPFLEGTKEMKEQTIKLVQEINDTRTEADFYSPQWNKKMKTREDKVLVQLPDSLNSSLVLGYFLTRFEEKYPGRVSFIGVNHQPVTTTDFKVGTNEKSFRARSVKYKIKAEMGQEMMIPYLEHIEQFPSLFRTPDFVFTVPVPGTPGAPTSGMLQVEITLEFFLSPKEWVPAGTPLAVSVGEETKEGEETWHQVFVSPTASKNLAEAAPAASRSLASLPGGRKRPFPKIDQVFGVSIVIKEKMYEEGTHAFGWKILKVDPESKTVTLKSGNKIKKLVVK